MGPPSDKAKSQTRRFFVRAARKRPMAGLAGAHSWRVVSLGARACKEASSVLSLPGGGACEKVARPPPPGRVLGPKLEASEQCAPDLLDVILAR